MSVNNSVGYIARGDLDYNKRPKLHSRVIRECEKSVFIAYLLWVFGGFFAAHLLYLRRDRQALIWWCTAGGYLGIGLMRDFFRIPTYVKDVNEDENYMKSLTEKMRTLKKPPFSLVRFCGQVLVGNSWGFLIAAAIPKEEIFGIYVNSLVHLAPLGTALAVWIIGNIGREEGDLKWALIGSYLVIPLTYIHPPLSNSSALLSAFTFTLKDRRWRRTPYPRISLARRFSVLCFCWLLFISLWASYLYFNAEVTTKQGEKIKLRDAAKNFLNSPMVLEFRKNLEKVYSFSQEHGWREAWNHFIELLDPFGEHHALKVIGLKKGVTQEEITTQYRSLAKQWHPDRFKDTVEKQAAQEKFVEIQQAYEKLSNLKRRRTNRNKLSRSDSSSADHKLDQKLEGKSIYIESYDTVPIFVK